MGTGVSDRGGGDAEFRIGEVAQRAGVTTRTLRYYQELGLLSPSGASPGGSRRYSEADVNRLLRILELRNVSKSFGAVFAVRDVNLRVDPREIVALVGDNGAGKSTLIKIISGVHAPDHGEMYVKG